MKINFIWLLALLLLWGGEASAQQDSGEAAKIQYLIGSVESLQGVVFIRNGSEYDARQAAEHLRLKLKRAGNRIKTAEEFIRLCASRSSLSGEAYRLKSPDGKTVDAEVFFRERLKTFPAGSPRQP